MIYWFFGYPGVGKDYLAEKLSQLVSIPHIDADNFLTNTDKKKLIEGTIAGIILSFVGAVIFVNYKEAFFGAVIGMIVESIELRYKNFVVNDNLTIPLFSGLAIYLLRII